MCVAVIAFLLFATLATSQQNNSLKKAIVLAQDTETNNSSLPEKPSSERAKEILGYYFSKYGGDYYELYTVLQCESSFNHNQYGDGGRAFGIAQFHRPTWDRFNKLRGTNLDYYGLEDQIDMFTWSFNNGLKSHWTCWSKLYK